MTFGSSPIFFNQVGNTLNTKPETPLHFKNKQAIEHVVEAQAAGIVASSEIHGTEIPGRISAATDAARETAILFLMFAFLIHLFSLPTLLLLAFGFGWLVWKTGRSAWLGWSRLERLHRIVAEEKWEIDNHRQQERVELKALYQAKGFEGKLLDDVVDVLMADGDRLLKVMVEEELGLSLEVHEHPLQQALGAFIGVVVSFSICMIGFIINPFIGVIACSTLSVASAAAISAKYEKNQNVPAIVWNLALMSIAFGSFYFIVKLI